MNKKILFCAIAILLVCITTVISSYIIGDAIKSVGSRETEKAVVDSPVCNLAQVAEYMNLPEKEVAQIIEIEENQLSSTHSFSGYMLPYFVVDGTKYFYKAEIDKWLEDVSRSRRVY